eukprot:COSAG04_NODE_3749_length_2560_cov_2.186103_2_plen_245_part_00
MAAGGAATPTLVAAPQLRAMLEQQPPPVVVAVGATPGPPCARFVPSAAYLPTTAIEAGPDSERWTPEMMEAGHGNILPAAAVLRAVAAAGVVPGSSVVVYSAGLAADPLPGARLVWALHWLNPTLSLRSLALLDGGLAGWLAAGFPTAPTPHQPPTPPPLPVAPAVDTACIATTEEVLAAVSAANGGAAGTAVLVDVRSEAEYRYPHLPRFFSIFSRFPLDFWPCSLDSWRPDGDDGRKMGENG